MAEALVSEHPDLSGFPGSPGQKRKRELESPNLGRTKRAAPPAAMSASPADTAAFIENAIEASQAASGVNVADFNALQQAAAADHTDASDPSNATSTAQAALGMYPTLHVPPSTEEQFSAQAVDHDHGHENAFKHDTPFGPDVTQQPDPMMDPTVNQNQPPPPPNGVQPHPPPPPQHRYAVPPPPNPKPSVGSEEWHKMRKDNHKEGEICWWTWAFFCFVFSGG